MLHDDYSRDTIASERVPCHVALVMLDESQVELEKRAFFSVSSSRSFYISLSSAVGVGWKPNHQELEKTNGFGISESIGFGIFTQVPDPSFRFGEWQMV